MILILNLELTTDKVYVFNTYSFDESISDYVLDFGVELTIDSSLDVAKELEGHTIVGAYHDVPEVAQKWIDDNQEKVIKVFKGLLIEMDDD